MSDPRTSLPCHVCYVAFFILLPLQFLIPRTCTCAGMFSKTRDQSFSLGMTKDQTLRQNLANNHQCQISSLVLVHPSIHTVLKQQREYFISLQYAVQRRFSQKISRLAGKEKNIPNNICWCFPIYLLYFLFMPLSAQKELSYQVYFIYEYINT